MNLLCLDRQGLAFVVMVMSAAAYGHGDDGVESSESAMPDACSDREASVWKLGEHIGALFTILACSALGAFLPIAGHIFTCWKTPNFALAVAKFFGIGVIIATGLIHMLPAAHNSLTDPCIGSFAKAYGSWASVFALIAIFVLHAIEYIITSITIWGPPETEDPPQEEFKESDSKDIKPSVSYEPELNEKDEDDVALGCQDESDTQDLRDAPPTPTSTLHELPNTASTAVNNYDRRQQQRQSWAESRSQVSFSSNRHSLQHRHSASMSSHACASRNADKRRLRLSAMSHQSATFAPPLHMPTIPPLSTLPGVYEGATLLSDPRKRSTSAAQSSSMSYCPCCASNPNIDSYPYYNPDQYPPYAATSKSPRLAQRAPSRMSYVSHISRIASLYHHYRLPTISQGSSIEGKRSTDASMLGDNRYSNSGPPVWCTPLLIEPRDQAEWHKYSTAANGSAIPLPSTRLSIQPSMAVAPSMRSPKTLASRHTAITYLLEAGISVHSVLIGITIGVATGSQFTSLLIAMSFHQAFEGLALGARLVDMSRLKKEHDYLYDPYLYRSNSTASTATFTAENSPEITCDNARLLSNPQHTDPTSIDPDRSTCKASIISAFIYAITTPLGIIVGMGIHSSYVSRSSSALLTQGILDSLSAGILLYTGLTTLLAHEFETLQFQSSSNSARLILFLSTYLGALLMCIVGIWA